MGDESQFAIGNRLADVGNRIAEPHDIARQSDNLVAQIKHLQRRLERHLLRHCRVNGRIQIIVIVAIVGLRWREDGKQATCHVARLNARQVHVAKPVTPNKISSGRG